MKRLILGAVAVLSLAPGALAQGSFDVDNEITGIAGLAVDGPGNWYGGTFGMEVWELNSTNIPPGVNLGAALGSGVRGYNAMVAAGFAKEATLAGQITRDGPGGFALGEVDMPDVWPPGATVVVALAAWSTGDPSWGAMLAHANQGTRAGLVAFVQPTANYTVSGGMTPPLLAMSQDLVMAAIPEPSAQALAVLGGAVLLLLRRLHLLRREHLG